ncbi:MAG: alpha/beta hydrolase [Oscillochloris sp.]|nr:alpha/beta hydrolase [Oscillochloris sp.]
MSNPVVIIGGWLSNPRDYVGMAKVLANPPYQRIVYVTDFNRRRWFAVRDPNFRPVLDALADTVHMALAETGADAVDIIGHSAGGRIARAYLGHLPFAGRVYNGQSHVHRLITLGTAHATNEVWVATFAAIMDGQYPGAFYSHVKYRSVAGRSVRGRLIGTPEEILAYQSYSVSFTDGNVIGDGIIPEKCCYLSGADNLVLVGARHSPYVTPGSWYGATQIIPAWFED